jgi:hypothetical protein
MRGDDLLERMRANPRGDWTIADVERLCRRHGLRCTAPTRGDHCKVRAPGIETVLTIPARRPIKPVYVRALAALVDRLQAGRNC